MKNLTDYYQSLRLMSAGVPRESADYFFVDDVPASIGSQMCKLPYPHIPCWSIGALWEYIFSNCGDIVYQFDTEMSSSELMDALIETARSLAAQNG